MYITRFTTVSNETQDYYYHNVEDAEKHLSLFLDDNSKLYDDCIPYELATQLYTTRDELEYCLKEIGKVAKTAGISQSQIDAYYYRYLEDFLIERGESLVPIEPPAEVLEIAELQKQLDEARKNQQIIIIETSGIDEDPSNLIPFSSYYIGNRGNTSSNDFILGGRQINLNFGNYIVNERDGAISYCPDEDQADIEVCSHFVAPSVYIKTQNAGETVNLCYYRDNEWHELRNVKKSSLYEPGSVAKYLIDHGIDANQDAGPAL